ncbi:hypothetical protein BsWGS_07621 [Bradybaena similaris]
MQIYAFPLLACAAVYLSSQGVCGRYVNDPSGLEDTFVDIGNEPTGVHTVFKRSPLLEEIDGPLSRNVRAVDETARSSLVYLRMRILLSILRMLLGRSPQVEILQFNNWDKTINIDQLFYVRPKTIWEVQKVILAARRLGMRVRATGAGHSRSPMYVDEGNIMMDTRDLQRHDGPRMEMRNKTAERDYMTLTAVPGVYEVEMNEFMTQNKVAILAQPLNDQETFGGMVAVGTHGSTWDGENFSGNVVEMRVMDSNGRLRRFTKERHPSIMKAAMCSLGMFGIMYDITIKVVPTFIAKAENHFVLMKDLIGNQTALRETITENFLTEISWFPFNNLTPEEEQYYNTTGKAPSSWSAANDYLWLRHINKATDEEVKGQEILPPVYLPTNGSLSGGSGKGLLKAKSSLDIARALNKKSYHYLVNAFPVIFPPRWGTETSAAFLLNIDNAFSTPYRALNFMVNRTEQQIKEKASTPLNALLPRFFKNSNCNLCYSNQEITRPDDSGRSLVIDFLAPPAQEGFYPAAADFVNHFKDEKVRPHWGKRHDNIVGIVDIIHKAYGPLIPQFQEQRQLAGIDPCDMFMNSYLLNIFGRSKSCIY